MNADTPCASRQGQRLGIGQHCSCDPTCSASNSELYSGEAPAVNIPENLLSPSATHGQAVQSTWPCRAEQACARADISQPASRGPHLRGLSVAKGEMAHITFTHQLPCGSHGTRSPAQHSALAAPSGRHFGSTHSQLLRSSAGGSFLKGELRVIWVLCQLAGCLLGVM